MLRWFLCAFAVFVVIAVILQDVQSCNEAVCGSIVSKCLLTQSCKCDFKKDCSCCKECANCLSYLYDECCSCVDMCPKPNDTRSGLHQQSHVEDLPNKIVQLFHALTDGVDLLERWTVVTFPVDIEFWLAPKNDMKYQLQSVEQEVTPIKPSNMTTFNCTVAYFARCLSWEKCRESCSSMGASSMRWFHDGCCECIGEHCINYGINESRCLLCSKREDSLNEELEEEELDSEEEYEYDN